MRKPPVLLSVLVIAALMPTARAQDITDKPKEPAVVACATCGCSEVCPIAMMETYTKEKNPALASNSIWGNMILRIAYDRDEKLNRLKTKVKITDSTTTGAIAAFAGGTIGQTALSIATLNPPAGLEDSYTPGILGLAINAGTNIAFNTRFLLNYKFHKQYQKRQIEIKKEVDAVLNKLEDAVGDSKEDFGEVKQELANLIGDKATDDCILLWRSSHQQLAGKPQNLSMLNRN